MTTPLFFPVPIAINDVDVIPVATFQDLQSSGVEGGTFTLGAWRTRRLTTQLGDMVIASLATNTITILVAGKYVLYGVAPANRVNGHQCRLNINAGGDLAYGSSAYSVTPNTYVTNSFVVAIKDLAVNDTVILEHRSEATLATFGFGRANTFANQQIYSQIILMKIAD